MADGPPDPDGPPLRTFVWFRRLALACTVAGVGLLTLRVVAIGLADHRRHARWASPA